MMLNKKEYQKKVQQRLNELKRGGIFIYIEVKEFLTIEK